MPVEAQSAHTPVRRYILEDSMRISIDIAPTGTSIIRQPAVATKSSNIKLQSALLQEEAELQHVYEGVVI